MKRDKPDEYEDALAAFRRTALLSDDLLFAHAKELVRQVKEKMGELMGASLTASGVKKTVPDLEAFNPFV